MELIGKYSLYIIIAMFVIFAAAEMLIPMNKSNGRVTFRWFTNFSMTLFIVLIFKLGSPVVAIVTASLTKYLEIGFFNNIDLSLPLVLLLGIIILDLKQYLFHWLMHYFDALWRIHQVHHSDVEIDLTTGFRFHPLEAILSELANIFVVVVFGIPAEVLLLRYLLIFFGNFFTHGNIYIAPTHDRYLRWVLVTPSMHHLHHAMDKTAANHNFGVFFSFWDRLFGTYMSRHPCSEQLADASDYDYGLREYREPTRLNLLLLILMPFKAAAISQNESIENQS
jgi:sterol desaturase/sphingolipid hydroxylase (fatty acid hydroxylase superfamily)